ncbi:MAG: hypothetical protein JWN54_2190 [Mycobacterium sp.]|jgi:uncharacterized membrane protein|nr:hypothetical protein [Mycobacterium sp.]
MADRTPARRLDTPRQDRRWTVPHWDPDTFGRFSERIARFSGTARFLLYMTAFIIIWLLWNSLAPESWRFDPYTFTFLTLLLSLQASYAAPLILLAQNRQADRDRVQLEEDRQRTTAAKADTEYLAREIAALRIALGEVATRDFVRSELRQLFDEDRRYDGDRATADPKREDRRDRRRDRRAEDRRDENALRGSHPDD